ncbi:MAG: NYN domain-containing protein [Rhodocyclales bacterium GT-UBC]|nr:MAG: NYN domain-containing protein [Rhodocyclales bacterium GT-UBC]
MAAANDTASMALFCDFENIALGVRDAQYEKFDIRPVLERLLAKGSIVVKKAYCDWDRYKGFKAAMHEANFELIEIPHVRQSGKNSADIRMVVDALDLCYTKSHVDTFVIISGDSDFSPLVSKLRENAKRVIGVGVKQSCSDLLVTNCDEFIYYDDLVRDREGERATQRREREKRSPEEEAKRREKLEERKTKGLDIVAATFVDLMADRGESERIWASVLKEVVKRRNPGFNENYYGFRSFGNLLEEAANRGLLGFGRDEKGAYVFRAQPRPVAVDIEPAGEAEQPVEPAVVEAPTSEGESAPATEESAGNGRRRGGRRSRNGKDRSATVDLPSAESPAGEPVETAGDVAPPVVEASPVVEGDSGNPRRRGGRRSRNAKERVTAEEVPSEAAPVTSPVESAEAPLAVDAPVSANDKVAKGKSPRARRPRKVAAAPAAEASGETIAAPTLAESAAGDMPPTAGSEKKPAKAKRTTRTPRARKTKAGEGEAA